MGEHFFFYKEFNPRLKPREFIKIRDEYYEVVECRPAFPWAIKITKITDPRGHEIELKKEDLKAESNEVLDMRIHIYGPVRVLFRIEGPSGPVFGGWGAAERFADEDTSENLLENVMFGDRIGWLYARIYPVVIPAWCKIKAEGYVYRVKRAEAKPQTYTMPPYMT